MHLSRLISIVLFAVLPVSLASAGDLDIVINGKSLHLDSSYDWNEDNVGLGLEYEFASESRWKKLIVANGFRDSADAMSYMAGAGLYRRLFESDRTSGTYIDVGLTAFLMTREDYNDNEVFPGVLPSLRLGNRRAGLNVAYLPKQAVERFLDARIVDPTLDGIVFLQLTVDLDGED